MRLKVTRVIRATLVLPVPAILVTLALPRRAILVTRARPKHAILVTRVQPRHATLAIHAQLKTRAIHVTHAIRALQKNNGTFVTAVIREPACRALFFASALLLQTACAHGEPTPAPETVKIPAGVFVLGSTHQEREYAYQLDEAAYGHSRTRSTKWYDQERLRKQATTGDFEITVTPITNEQYSRFIAAGNHPAPNVDKETWQTYALIHPFERTRKHAWKNNQPPTGREQHPVVLISYNDATAYADWLSESRNEQWRLPTEDEWEKAVRGTEGHFFPWGNKFDSDKLNSHDSGPFDTVAVGTRSTAGPFGLLDGAGQVFEWILTPDDTQTKRAWVKGGSWDDKGCGVCRPAARHSRPRFLKHILVGFRLVRTP